MARRSSRRLVVPGAEKAMDAFKVEMMRREGYNVNPNRPDDVKYEVARNLGVPLTRGYNGELTTESVGLVGGKIGGTMVREMVRLAKEQLAKQPR